MAEEQANQDEQQEKAKETKGNSQFLLLLALILNFVFMIGIGVMLYLGRMANQKQETIDDVVRGEIEQQKKELDAQTGKSLGTLIPLESFVVNLAGASGRKILKVNMELQVEGEEIQNEIDSRKAQIRDIIIVTLSSKRIEELARKEGKDSLREEIRSTVNSFLTSGKVQKVFFTEFVFN